MMMEAQEEVMIMGCNNEDHTQIIKGKRTKRQRLAAAASAATATASSSSTGGGVVLDRATALSPATTSTEFTESVNTEEEEDMANCLILLAQGRYNRSKVISPPPVASKAAAVAAGAGLFVYECKTCNRCFPSFQALGGHRASHRKLIKASNNAEEKKALAFVDDQEDEQFKNMTTTTTLSLQISNRVLCSSNNNNNKSKVHECVICGAEFSSGQALGGHMRRHRTYMSSSTAPTMAATTSSPDQSQEANKKPRNILQLDLNLPAAPEDDHHRPESKFSFVSKKEQVLVFSASPLVDCHY